MTAESVIEQYTKAWMGRDLDEARTWLADDLDFQGSIDRFTSADGYIAALRQFMTIVTRIDMLARYHDESGGALLYDCYTDSAAGVIQTAEFLSVRGRRVAAIRLVFDATALRALMAK